jgi:hypothetical protein
MLSLKQINIYEVGETWPAVHPTPSLSVEERGVGKDF